MRIPGIAEPLLEHKVLGGIHGGIVILAIPRATHVRVPIPRVEGSVVLYGLTQPPGGRRLAVPLREERLPHRMPARLVGGPLDGQVRTVPRQRFDVGWRLWLVEERARSCYLYGGDARVGGPALFVHWQLRPSTVG